MHETRLNYHRAILAQYCRRADNIRVNSSYTSSDNFTLNATVFGSDSNIGIIIVPGIWYPREAYYKLACDLNERYQVMVYDQRGHCHSQGDFDVSLMVADLKAVAGSFCEIENISRLFIVGHSLGGYISAIATSRMTLSDLSGQILLAPPVSLFATKRKIPAKMTPFKIYLLNLLRATAPKYRGRMVREYVSFWYPSFKKQPYLFAMRADNPQEIINRIKATKLLSDLLDDLTIKTLCLWGNNDSTLGINLQTNPLYSNFIKKFTDKSGNLTVSFIQRMSHQLNFDDKKEISVAADTDTIKLKIFQFVDETLKATKT